jgi:hypothetical protein
VNKQIDQSLKFEVLATYGSEIVKHKKILNKISEIPITLLDGLMLDKITIEANLYTQEDAQNLIDFFSSCKWALPNKKGKY